MRCLAVLLLLGVATLPGLAQWQVFAEKLPKPGTWATYRMETLRDGKEPSVTTLRLSVQPGREVNGRVHVWFTVEPVMWLGSRERAPLRLLVHPDMDRHDASRLIENSEEIVFSNPVKGAYHMTREDIAWVSDWAKLTYTSELTPDSPAKETIEAGGRARSCERLRMLATTTTDPPMVSKQVLTFKGNVWRDTTAPFGVVRAEWEEETVKGSETKRDRKKLTLIDSGWEAPSAGPLDRGREFSVWRLIFGR
jgi:hypothetical protein